LKRKTIPPEWSLQAETRLKLLGLTKMDLHELTGINYTSLCSIFSGGLVRPEKQALILTKLDELEKEV